MSSNASVSTGLPLTLAASGVLGLCFAVGVPGNIAVLVVLARWLKGGRFTPRLMMSLAVSDLLTLLPLPVWIWALLNGWVFGLVLCKIFSYVIYWNIYCSVLCVTSLSVQRYLQVLHSQKWAKLRQKDQQVLVTAMWFLSATLASYVLIQRSVLRDDAGTLHCRQHYSSDTEKGVHHATFIRSHRMTNLVSRIVVAFFIFWLPIHVNNVLLAAAVLLGRDGLLRFAQAGGNMAGALTFINSCVNPLLYAFSAHALRQHTPGSESA
ncbi:apelin receptor A-like isoform X2 [Brachyhypopomus gauderio]|uniref:apelin receptor A-like isoform X2 n=1 Tax=Brachyhypopomus gauderio TaxID=698409 RepID=UPI00404181A2